MTDHSLLPNISAEEWANCLCSVLHCLSPAVPGPWLCSPGPLLSPHCPCVFNLGASCSAEELPPKMGPVTCPSSPHTTPEKGLVRHQQLPWQHAFRPWSPWCTPQSQAASKTADSVPRGLPGPAGRTGLCRLAARRGQGFPPGGDPQPARGPDSIPSFGDLPQLTWTTPPRGTGHRAPDSEPPHGTSCFAGDCINPV